MSTYFNDIQAAFDAKLTASVSHPIAYPNIFFVPSADTIYIRPTFLPAETSQASLGSAGKDETNGIYQIEIMTPRGSGRPSDVDSVADAFKRGTVLTYNGIQVRVRSVSIGVSIMIDAAYYSVPISVNFQTFTEARS